MLSAQYASEYFFNCKVKQSLQYISNDWLSLGFVMFTISKPSRQAASTIGGVDCDSPNAEIFLKHISSSALSPDRISPFFDNPGGHFNVS